jgi:hypothetical protein
MTMAVVSVLPALGLVPRYLLFGPDSKLLLIMLGFVIVLGGVFDHWWLVHTLHPIPEENRG